MPVVDSRLRRIVFDVAEALSFLHFTVKAVHTDLKPENILAELPHGGTREWSLCDLGSASFYSPGKLDNDLITTRPYRAPEVVMGKGWSYPADAWSLGCILYELRTGRKLFDCNNDGDHLALMEQRLGAIPTHLRTSRQPLVRSSSCPDLLGATRGRTLQQEFNGSDDAFFLSLLLGLLEFDPARRLRCDAVLHHEFFKGLREASDAKEQEVVTAMLQPSATKVTVTSTRVPLGVVAASNGRSVGVQRKLVLPAPPPCSSDPGIYCASAPTSAHNSPENIRPLPLMVPKPSATLISPAYHKNAYRVSFL
jgi:serine/threonine protein kinase